MLEAGCSDHKPCTKISDISFGHVGSERGHSTPIEIGQIKLHPVDEKTWGTYIMQCVDNSLNIAFMATDHVDHFWKDCLEFALAQADTNN